METDKRLEILCEEFSNLEEFEKDYILEISESLVQSVSAKVDNTGTQNIYLNNFYGGI